jgi:hypothetical protein
MAMTGMTGLARRFEKLPLRVQQGIGWAVLVLVCLAVTVAPWWAVLGSIVSLCVYVAVLLIVRHERW